MNGKTIVALFAVWQCGATVHSQVVPAPADQPRLTWRALPELPNRGDAAIAYDEHRDRLVLFGGSGSAGPRPWFVSDETWEWDGARWRRREPVVRPPAREGHSMAYDQTRKMVILFGGRHFDKLNRPVLLDDMWAWDGREWHELRPAVRPAPRRLMAMATDPVRQRIVVFGGIVVDTGFPQPAADTWEWDGVSWVQVYPAVSPQPNWGVSMAFCGTAGKLTLYDPTVSQTWEWSGQQWAQATNGPNVIWRAPMAAEPATGSVVLYDVTGATWVWNGSTWRQAAGTGPPMLSYTGVWMTAAHGGRAWFVGTHGVAAGTWVWQGSAWQQFADLVEPIGRYRAVSQPARDELLIVWDSYGVFDLETWRFSEAGGYQELQSVTRPPSRAGFRLLYHKGLQQALMYGGVWGSNAFNDLWRWDGTDWHSIPVSGPLPPAGPAGVAYDSVRDKVMVVVPRVQQLWEWDPTNGWVMKVPAQPHGAGGNLALGFDPRRNRLVLIDSGVWELEASGWVSKSARQPPPTGWDFVYEPHLGGLVRIGYDGTVWVWRGDDGQIVGAIDRSANPVQQILSTTYDAGRQRLWAFGGGDQPGPDAWSLAPRPLAGPEYVRPGETLELTLEWPQEHGSLFLLAFSRSTAPAIPLIADPGVGTRLLPLAADEVLNASLTLGLTRSISGAGLAKFAFNVPPDPSIVGQRFFAAGIAVRSPGILSDVTNAVELEIGW